MLQNVDSGVFSILDRDNYLIRETDDRLFVPADFIVMHTDLIRTGRFRHAHIAILNRKPVIGAILKADGFCMIFREWISPIFHTVHRHNGNCIFCRYVLVILHCNICTDRRHK